MSRRWVWLPVVGLCGLAAVWGYALGRVPGETEIINRYAARYVLEVDGGLLTDCVARPGEGAGVRLVVICTPESGDVVRYYSGPRGGEVLVPVLEGEI